MGTFHALCCQFLRKHGTKIGLDKDFHVINIANTKYYLEEIIKEYENKNQATSFFNVDDIRSHISDFKLDRVSPKIFLKEIVMTETDLDKRKKFMFIYEVYNQYEKLKTQMNALDYDDLTENTVELFNQFPHVYTQRQDLTQHILVHNFDNLNDFQYEVFKKISNDSISITITLKNEDCKYLEYFESDYGGYSHFRLDPEESEISNNSTDDSTNQFESKEEPKSIDKTDSLTKKESHNLEIKDLSSLKREVFNPLSPLYSGQLEWNWKFISHSPSNKENIKQSVVLYTVLHRGGVIFGYTSSNDYIPKYCVKVSRIQDQSDSSFSLTIDNDEYHSSSLVLKAENDQIGNKWYRYIETSIIDSSRVEHGKKKSFPMPEIFHQKNFTEESEFIDVNISYLEGPEPYKQHIQSCVQYIQKVIDNTHKSASQQLQEQIKAQYSDSELKDQLNNLSFVSKLQKKVVIDTQSILQSHKIINRDDVDSWLIQWSKMLSEKAAPKFEEEISRLVIQKIISELELNLNSLEIKKNQKMHVKSDRLDSSLNQKSVSFSQDTVENQYDNSSIDNENLESSENIENRDRYQSASPTFIQALRDSQLKLSPSSNSLPSVKSFVSQEDINQFLDSSNLLDQKLSPLSNSSPRVFTQFNEQKNSPLRQSNTLHEDKPNIIIPQPIEIESDSGSFTKQDSPNSKTDNEDNDSVDGNHRSAIENALTARLTSFSKTNSPSSKFNSSINSQSNQKANSSSFSTVNTSQSFTSPNLKYVNDTSERRKASPLPERRTETFSRINTDHENQDSTGRNILNKIPNQSQSKSNINSNSNSKSQPTSNSNTQGLDFPQIFDSMKKLQEKMDQIQNSEFSENEKELMKKELKETFRKLAESISS